jgi:methylated-DNA-protein-cysteine methyltransferase-like protein
MADQKDFYEKVFDIVRQIPRGRVTTYGDIGRAIGMRSSARMVGWAVNSAKGRDDMPCHRVVNRLGELTGRMHFATPHLMRELLESEGIEFIGERVDLAKCLWRPPLSDD